MNLPTYLKNISIYIILGPLPLPIIGNIHHIVRGDPIIFRSFHKLQQKYGPVVKFWLGSKQATVISGIEELKVGSTKIIYYV